MNSASASTSALSSNNKMTPAGLKEFFTKWIHYELGVKGKNPAAVAITVGDTDFLDFCLQPEQLDMIKKLHYGIGRIGMPVLETRNMSTQDYLAYLQVDLLSEALSAGQYAMADHLIHGFRLDLTPRMIALVESYLNFRDIDKAKFMMKSYSFKNVMTDAVADAFQQAVAENELEIAELLLKNFDFGDVVTPDIIFLFEKALVQKKMDLVDYLVKRFDFHRHGLLANFIFDVGTSFSASNNVEDNLQALNWIWDNGIDTTVGDDVDQFFVDAIKARVNMRLIGWLIDHDIEPSANFWKNADRTIGVNDAKVKQLKRWLEIRDNNLKLYSSGNSKYGDFDGDEKMAEDKMRLYSSSNPKYGDFDGDERMAEDRRNMSYSQVRLSPRRGDEMGASGSAPRMVYSSQNNNNATQNVTLSPRRGDEMSRTVTMGMGGSAPRVVYSSQNNNNDHGLQNVTLSTRRGDEFPPTVAVGSNPADTRILQTNGGSQQSLRSVLEGKEGVTTRYSLKDYQKAGEKKA